MNETVEKVDIETISYVENPPPYNHPSLLGTHNGRGDLSHL
jgi:hypothetical protein